jgi:hypothetical protein
MVRTLRKVQAGYSYGVCVFTQCVVDHNHDPDHKVTLFNYLHASFDAVPNSYLISDDDMPANILANSPSDLSEVVTSIKHVLYTPTTSHMYIHNYDTHTRPDSMQKSKFYLQTHKKVRQKKSGKGDC